MLGQQFVQGFRVGVAGQADVLWGQDKSARFVYSAPRGVGWVAEPRARDRVSQAGLLPGPHRKVERRHGGRVTLNGSTSRMETLKLYLALEVWEAG